MCQGNAGECQGDAGEFQGNVWKLVQSPRGMHENDGNVTEWVQCASAMQGNTRGMYGSGCKVPGAGESQGNVLEWVQSAMRMHGNAGECRGMQEFARGT